MQCTRPATQPACKARPWQWTWRHQLIWPAARHRPTGGVHTSAPGSYGCPKVSASTWPCMTSRQSTQMWTVSPNPVTSTPIWVRRIRWPIGRSTPAHSEFVTWWRHAQTSSRYTSRALLIHWSVLWEKTSSYCIYRVGTWLLVNHYITESAVLAQQIETKIYTCTAVGCLDPSLPSHMTWSRQDDVITVTCQATGSVLKMTCQGNNWEPAPRPDHCPTSSGTAANVYWQHRHNFVLMDIRSSSSTASFLASPP